MTCKWIVFSVWLAAGWLLYNIHMSPPPPTGRPVSQALMLRHILPLSSSPWLHARPGLQVFVIPTQLPIDHTSSCVLHILIIALTSHKIHTSTLFFALWFLFIYPVPAARRRFRVKSGIRENTPLSRSRRGAWQQGIRTYVPECCAVYCLWHM